MDVQQILSVVRLERSRRRWRWIGILALLAVGGLVFALAKRDDAHAAGAHIARITIEGMILEDAPTRDMLASLAADDSVQGVIVRVNSPGGTMVGGLEIHDGLRAIAAKKPVATVMGTTAASAGYLVAMAGDHMVASPGTLTGSIGVFMPLVDATGLAAKLGVREDSVVSGVMKDATSPLSPRDASARAYLQGLVDSLDGVFLNMVVARRQPPEATVALIRDGRALSGVQARQLGLVDALGGEAAALSWLTTQHKRTTPLPVEDYQPEDRRGFMARALEASFRGVLQAAVSGQGVMALAR